MRPEAVPVVEPDESADDWDGWLAAEAGRFLLFARSRTGSEADAEDVLQESLVEAWQRTPAGRRPDAALVFATIRRRALDLARGRHRRQRREEASSGDLGDHAVWFECDLEHAETRQQLEQAVRSLPVALREVVALKTWGGLTFAQIAETVGCPPNTAASRYRYGLDALRQRLKGVLV